MPDTSSAINSKKTSRRNPFFVFGTLLIVGAIMLWMVISSTCKRRRAV